MTSSYIISWVRIMYSDVSISGGESVGGPLMSFSWHVRYLFGHLHSEKRLEILSGANIC